MCQNANEFCRYRSSPGGPFRYSPGLFVCCEDKELPAATLHHQAGHIIYENTDDVSSSESEDERQEPKTKETRVKGAGL